MPTTKRATCRGKLVAMTEATAGGVVEAGKDFNRGVDGGDVGDGMNSGPNDDFDDVSVLLTASPLRSKNDKEAFAGGGDLENGGWGTL